MKKLVKKSGIVLGVVISGLFMANVVVNLSPKESSKVSKVETYSPTALSMETTLHFDGKCGDGKCGAKDAKESKDAKMDHKKMKQDKSKDSKCGDGKCGAKDAKESKTAKTTKTSKKEAKTHKAKDSKCGTGKCGTY